MTKFTEEQQDANWDNLSREQKSYFNRLAEDDPERTGQAFFEDEVPVSLQDDPEKLSVYLDGGTVTTEEWVPSRGRNGGEYEQVEHRIEDRDWSHDVSRANGGSDSADNGRFEDASTNRARGSRNTTEAEQQAADAHSEYDADLLERGTVVESIDSNVELVSETAAESTSFISDLGDALIDGILPAVAAYKAGTYVGSKFKDPVDQVGYGSAAAGGAALLMTTPAGPIIATGYGIYAVGKLSLRLYARFSR